MSTTVAHACGFFSMFYILCKDLQAAKFGKQDNVFKYGILELMMNLFFVLSSVFILIIIFRTEALVSQN